MKKPRLLFVFDNAHEDLWMDGLWAALNLLEEDFEITKYNLHNDDQYQAFRDLENKPRWDFLLGWGAFDRSVARYLLNTTGIKKGLCIGGVAIPPIRANEFDVLFYETKWYRPQIDFHPNIVQAFGVNTDIFSPIDIPTPIVWDYIGVGALADWKRWNRMKNKQGNRLVVGEYQVNNEYESANIAMDLLKDGVMVSGMVNPFDLALLYHYSRTLYISANTLGGGERAVLEARSCGLQVEIEDDNPKLKELVDLEQIPSHFDYAKQLKKGILSCLS